MSLCAATLVLGVVFLSAGALCLFVSVKGSDWFFGNVGVRSVTGRMSRRRARVLYGVIGAAIMAMAVKMLMDVS